MSTYSIELSKMNLQGCARFLAQLEVREGVERYAIDVGSLGYVSPFGMLACSLAIRRFRASLPDCEFSLRNYEEKTYPGHMGFFRAFGAQYGNWPGEAEGNSHYLPITLVDLDDIRAEAKTNLEVAQKTIERLAGRCSKVLVQEDEPELIATLSYAMTEMFRNVLEHSEAHQIGYCAQYWPSKDRVEVGIVDGGIGIGSSLRQNRHLEIQHEKHALELALLPGVSGKITASKRAHDHDYWANSGFGLFVTSALCRMGGDFLIASDGVGLKLRGSEQTTNSIDLPGTAIRLRVKPSAVGELGPVLRDIVAKGERIAKRIDGAVPTASGASKLLREFE